MRRFTMSCAALACFALAGCGKADEEIDPAPVAQLQGAWQMYYRSPSCETSYAVFSPVGVYKVSESNPPKKYFSIRKYTLEAGKFTLLTQGLGREPEDELSLVFSLAEDRIRLLDIRTDKVPSFKEPPKTIEGMELAWLKATLRVNEQRFALDKCATREFAEGGVKGIISKM